MLIKKLLLVIVSTMLWETTVFASNDFRDNFEDASKSTSEPQFSKNVIKILDWYELEPATYRDFLKLANTQQDSMIEDLQTQLNIPKQTVIKCILAAKAIVKEQGIDCHALLAQAVQMPTPHFRTKCVSPLIKKALLQYASPSQEDFRQLSRIFHVHIITVENINGKRFKKYPAAGNASSKSQESIYNASLTSIDKRERLCQKRRRAQFLEPWPLEDMRLPFKRQCTLPTFPDVRLVPSAAPFAVFPAASYPLVSNPVYINPGQQHMYSPPYIHRTRPLPFYHLPYGRPPAYPSQDPIMRLQAIPDFERAKQLQQADTISEVKETSFEPREKISINDLLN